jgi:hypothetical protein
MLEGSLAPSQPDLAEHATAIARKDIYDFAPSRGLVGWNRLPAVLDASILLNDILDAARGHGGSLLLLAARKEIAHLFAAEQIREEVERHLERRALQGHVAPERAFEVWRDNYLRQIRFVSVEGVPRGRAARRLADRDPTDLPTAVLAELLAPCLVFAADKDLTDTGIARRDWSAIVHNAEEAQQLELLFSGGSVLTLLLGVLGYEGVKGIARLARAAPLPTLIGAILIGLVAHSHLTSDRGHRQISDGKGLAKDIGSRFGEVIDTAMTARAVVRSAAFVLEAEPIDLAHAARAVAVAPSPPRASEVAFEMGVSTQKAAAVLRDGLFTRTTESTYLLGTSYAPIEVGVVRYPAITD